MGVEYNQYAFAWPLKAALKVLLGFTDDQLNDHALKDTVSEYWGVSPRHAMQRLGTEFGRKMIHEDAWIKRGEIEVRKNLNNGRGTIISDVRFENEAQWVRNFSTQAFIIHVNPPVSSLKPSSHESEAGIKVHPLDRVVINDKSLGFDPLHAQLDQIISRSLKVFMLKQVHR